MPTVRVNGVELYHEIRGSGPPVLLIMGGTGDGGHFDTLADLLADEFTVVTYDRRGNGRSPVPTGWTTTSPQEQADDAAGLVDALAVGPTAVFGTSSGGNFALWTLTRHPAIVRGAVLHDPGVSRSSTTSTRSERFVVAIGVDPARALEQVEAGTADYAIQLPRHVGPQLESAYGPASEAARAGHQQYFVNEALGLRILHMNTSRPLFSDVRLRRAVNYAIDRSALAAQGRRAAEINPFNAGTPTDDYVPPSASGAADFQVYPLSGPDLLRARHIAGRVRATAIMYTPNVSPSREEAQIVRRNLRPLGIDVQIKEFAIGDFFTRVTRPGEPFDLAVSGYSFLSDPLEMLGLYRRGGIIGAANISHFRNPRLRPEVRSGGQAVGRQALPGRKPSRARASARLGSVGGLRDHRQPRFLLGTDRVPDLSAHVGHRPGRPLPASMSE